jgi:hypothetical protein
MYIREHDSTPLGESIFARRTPGKVEAAVWSHGTSNLAKSEATMFMNEVLENLGPANVALFDGIDVQLHIIPHNVRLTDMPEFASLKGKTTHDGRKYEDVRGMGGMRFGNSILFAVGQEMLMSVPGNKPGFTRGGAPSHETGHVVGLFALTPSQQARLDQAFKKQAEAKGPWVDDYASSNTKEYFASCTSAFFGRPPTIQANDTARFNRAWLKANDRRMYALLADVYKRARA